MDGLLDTGGFNRCKRCRHGHMLFNANDVHIGQSLDLYGEWAESELELLCSFLHVGDVVIDVGANVGTHTVFFARQVGPSGAVVAIEPQRIVFQTLCANLALNSLANVYAFHAAAGGQPGSVVVPLLNYEAPRNFGGVSLGVDGAGERVSMMTLDQLALERCRLLKVDVEGMELEVLQGGAALIKTCRPLIYIENNNARKSPTLIQALLDLEYRLFWHFSGFFNPQNFFNHAENVFGPLADVNMIGAGPDLAGRFEHLPRVEGADDTGEAALQRLSGG